MTTSQGVAGASILVVEDEPDVASATARALRSLGYRVVIAPTMEEARRQSSRYACGVFDFGVPDGGGLDLARELLSRGTVGKAVFFSATSNEDLKARASAVGVFVDKRSGIAAMASHVRAQLLEKPRRPGFALRYGHVSIPIKPGEHFIGREVSCLIALGGDLVSRRHARLAATSTAVWLEDLNSTNGVFVDGRRITGRHQLAIGNRIVVGEHTLELVSDEGAPRGVAETTNRAGASTTIDPPPPGGDAQSLATSRVEGFRTLCQVAERLFLLKQTEQAEELLKGHLEGLLGDAQRGTELERALCDQAADLTLRLAKESGNERWLRFVFELFAAVRAPMSARQVDSVFDCVRAFPSFDRAPVRRYLMMLGRPGHEVPSRDRLALQRLRGL